MWAILQRAPLWLFIAMLIGVFTKETTLLLWPLLWLADNVDARKKLLWSALLIPGTLAFLIFRFILDPDPGGSSVVEIELASGFVDQLRHMLTPNGLIDITSSFNLFWIPAAFAAFCLPYPSILRRWLWIVPVLMAMILLHGGNYGRILFMAFPVVIPLALVGIRYWITPIENVSAH
jgi:hypothetical protein